MKHSNPARTPGAPYPVQRTVLVQCVVLYLGTWVFCVAIPRLCGIAPESVHPGPIRPDGMVLLMVMGILGVVRTVRAHPVLHASYGKWLALTPWEHPMPLPLGSPRLEWRDGLLLAVAAAAAIWGSHLNPLLPLIVFGIAYLLPALAVLHGQGARPAACGIAFGLAAVVRFWPAYPLVAAILVALHLLTYVGLGVTLRQFSVEREPRDELRRLSRNLGWPFTQLNPVAPPEPISPARTLLIALMAGWWTYCIAAQLEAKGEGLTALGAATFAGGWVALARFVIYTAGIRPPAGVLGRIGSGRWIIPEYDRVLLAPLYVTLVPIVVGVIGYIATVKAGLSCAVLSGGLVGLALLLGLGLGPTLRDWRLCGEFSVIRNAPRNRAHQRSNLQHAIGSSAGPSEANWVTVQG